MSVTIIIIVATCLTSFAAFNNPDLRSQLIFHPVTVNNRGEWYRFITSGFIHADFQHLLFNMWALYIFGSAAENLFIEGVNFVDLQGIKANMIKPIFGPTIGPIMFLFFYLSSIAAASYVSFIRHKDNYGYASLGASGGVSAMMWPFIMLAPWSWFIFPPLPAILLGPAYILYSIYMDKRGNDNIGHSAHLWGAVFGLIFYLSFLIFRRPELLNFFWTQLLSP